MPWFWRKRPTNTATRGVKSAGQQDATLRLSGRRYLKAVPYAFPKDPEEINRLDFQHFMLRQLFQGNINAPIKNPRAVLDSACGTGRWAMEIATQFPDANVVGVDIVVPEITKTTLGYGISQIPTNVVFEQGNILEELPFAAETFDYVHQRLVIAAIPSARWADLVRELARVTQRGGWIELIEGNPFPTGAPAIDQLATWAAQLLAKRGIDLQDSGRIDRLLHNAGLREVTMREFPLIPGAHAGRMGSLVATDVLSIITGMRGPIVASGIADGVAFDEALRQWPLEVAKVRTKTPVYVAYGQKI